MSNYDNLHLGSAEFRANLTHGLAEPSTSKMLSQAAERSYKQALALSHDYPEYQSWREAAHQVKSYVVANLDKLLVEFERNMTARGATVLFAKDAEEANRLVLDIAKEHNVKSVVKAKSMVSEELNLNHVFAEAGIRAMETDLGEYIVQLAGQRPVHLVAPAMHMTAGEVGQLFADKLGEPYTEEHQALTMIARRRLRQEYLAADMGISGGNFIIADTGSLVLVENEGNAGLSTSTPPVHVALVGIEKLLPSIDYLPLFLNLLILTCTNQKLTSYVHCIHGPVAGKKLYVILIDNGRTNLLKDPAAKSSLHCIRCGACLYACPVYRHAGGWAYGWVYPGPIGSILTPHFLGIETAGELPFACSLCGACGEICPVKIDLPHQLVHLRYRAVNEPSPKNSAWERFIWIVWAWFMVRPLRYKLLMTGVRLGTKIAKFLPWKPGKLGAWSRGRALPQATAPAFRSWWKSRK
jgi:L-lactate dehydrogenase complex protein LldF